MALMIILRGMSGSVCINHPDQAAVARCVTCSKPVCAKCVTKADGHTFCSGTCRDNRAKFQAGYKPKEDGVLAGLMSYVKLLVALAVIAAIVLFVGGKVLGIGACQSILKIFGL